MNSRCVGNSRIFALLAGLFSSMLIFSAQAANKIICPHDDIRYEIDVKEFALSYQSSGLEATLSGLSVLGARVSVEPKTLQQAAVATQKLNEFIKALAIGYNSCAISKQAYEEAIKGLLPAMQADGKALETLHQQVLDERKIDNKELEKLLRELSRIVESLARISGKKIDYDRISSIVYEQSGKSAEAILQAQKTGQEVILHEIHEMKEWMDGDFKDSAAYYAVSIGTWHSRQVWIPKFSVEYERLTPYAENEYFNNLSFFGELGLLKWRETIKYKTLPGIPESELGNNHNIVSLSVGTRAFYKLKEQSYYYVFLSGGHSIAGSEDTFSYAVGTGIEYTKKSVRAGIEIRWEGFTSIEQPSVNFNAFGNTHVDIAHNHQGGPLLAARIAFH